MEIVHYDKEKRVLSIRYNTKVIWEYQGVNEDEYKAVLNATSETKVRKLLSQQFIVGEYKGVK